MKKKAYEKPDVKMISLLTPDRIANEDEDMEGNVLDGSVGAEDSIF